MLLALQKTSARTRKEELNDEAPQDHEEAPGALCSHCAAAWAETDPALERGKRSISQCPRGVKTRFLEVAGSYKCCVFRSQEESLQSLEIANFHPEKPLKALQLSSQHLWSPSSPLALGNCR